MSQRHFGWSILRNTAAQIAGRNLIALGRLIVAGIIVRAFGTDAFGEYSLVFGILVIGEWLVDFGMTEVFVREICREPQRENALLRMITAAKLVQIPIAVVVSMAVLVALRYPVQILQAGAIGALSLVFFAGVVIYRTTFKATLTLEREMAAELIAVLTMIPLLSLAGSRGGGLVSIALCHLCSRAVFFGLCVWFGRKRFRLSVGGVKWQEVRWSLRASTSLGLIGLLVAVYEILDILLLSKFGMLSEVPYYSAAQKLIWPMLTALSSIGGTLYPIAATYWPQDRPRFEETCQRGFEATVVLAGFLVCSLLAGAEFFLSLLGPEIVRGAPALRILALLCFAKAITSTVGPLLYVVHAQLATLKLTIVAVLMKLVVVATLAFRFGFIGVAAGALAVEVCFAMVPAVKILEKTGGYSLNWAVPMKVAVITGISAGVPALIGPLGSVYAAALAPIVYGPLVFLSGAVRLSDLYSLIRWKTA